MFDVIKLFGVWRYLVPLQTIEDGEAGLQKQKITHLMLKGALLCNE